MASTVKTRLLLLSDTHFYSLFRPDMTRKDIPFHNPLPHVDILIHAGDLTSTGLHYEHVLAVSLLRSHPAELKLIIPGNHDITLDVPFYTKERPHMAGTTYPEDIGAIKALYTSAEAVADGIRYLEEGTHKFKVSNGASFTVYASAYTPAFCDWAFAYEREEDRFSDSLKLDGSAANLESFVPDFPGVDIMITHGPPEGVRDFVESTGENVGCEHLWKAVARAKPLLHVFGHIHEGWGAELWYWGRTQHMAEEDIPGTCVLTMNRNVSDEMKEDWVRERGRFMDISSKVHGKDTLFVNASIMDVRYRPINAPWVVDLNLPLGR